MDHTVEGCPQLIAKWHAKITGNQNQNPNTNHNVHKIYVKPWEPNIFVLTRGGGVIGDDQGMHGVNPRVWLMT